jgi:uncharacterized protein (TIGR01777 family)
MRIGITGVSGLIGRHVARLARERGHAVIGFTRKPARGDPNSRLFDLENAPDVSGCDAILNLAGQSVATLWTASKRRAIRESRVLGTRRIVEAIRKADKPPAVLVNGSATGIYGDTGDEEADEVAAHGSGFLTDVCNEWEQEALAVREAGVRVALLRTGIVLAREGGALAAMLPIFRLGLGGELGDGRQWMSWIHIEDEAALALYLIENPGLDGAVNATAPEPVRNADYTKMLAEALHGPAFLRVPALALRVALDGFATELLESRRVVPSAATRAGFAFRFAGLREALADLL